MPDPRRLLWQIDDHDGWLALSAATVARVPGWGFRGFTGPDAALAAWQDGDPRPDAILVDYYLGDHRGDEVAAVLRELDARVVIIGHSSVPSCSARIVLAGGDLVLPKRAEGGINRALLAWLRDGAPPAGS
jgi:hypothetical protein